MTFDEYYFYSDVALKLFDYMNGRINRMNNKCIISIDMYDLVNNTYANIRHPKYVFVHIGTIVDSWKDEWSSIVNKKDYVGTCIAWAIAHELFHADQLLSMIQYNKNIDYRNSIENDVSRASYDWVANHCKQISKIGGFNVIIKHIESDSLPEKGHYKRANAKQFYLQIIANVVLRDFDAFNKLTIFTDDSLADNIIIRFNNTDSIAIKSNGEYLEQNINLFSDMVYHWTAYYDKYNIQINVSPCDIDNRSVVFVDFSISNALINGMTF